jgi:hypothetical protein
MKKDSDMDERAVRLAVDAVFKMFPREKSALYKSFYGE